MARFGQGWVKGGDDTVHEGLHTIHLRDQEVPISLCNSLKVGGLRLARSHHATVTGVDTEARVCMARSELAQARARVKSAVPTS